MDEKAFSRSLLSAERTPGQLRNFSNKRGNGLWSRGVTAVFGGWSFEKRRLCRHKPARLIRPTRLNIGSLTTQCGQIEPVLPPSLSLCLPVLSVSSLASYSSHFQISLTLSCLSSLSHFIINEHFADCESYRSGCLGWGQRIWCSGSRAEHISKPVL